MLGFHRLDTTPPRPLRISPRGGLRALLLAAGVLLASAASPLLAPRVCAAAQATPTLARARKLYRDLEYRRAADMLQRLLGTSKIDKAQRIEIYRLLGLCKAILNKPAEARAAFSALLDLNPDFELDKMTTPRALDLFRAVKASRPSKPSTKIEVRPISIAHVAPLRAAPGLPLTLTVRVSDPRKLTRKVALYYRRLGVEAFARVDARHASTARYEAQINGTKVIAPRLEYYFVALGQGDKVLATVGQASLPLRIAVEKRSAVAATGTPVYKRWWFWTIIGGVAAGAAAGIIVGVTRSSGETTPPPTPPKTVDVSVSFTQ